MGGITMETRKQTYERKQNELLERCRICTGYNSPTPECCDYGCSTGKKLRWLEVEYADVTGWNHQGNWKKEV